MNCPYSNHGFFAEELLFRGWLLGELEKDYRPAIGLHIVQDQAPPAKPIKRVEKFRHIPANFPQRR